MVERQIDVCYIILLHTALNRCMAVPVLFGYLGWVNMLLSDALSALLGEREGEDREGRREGGREASSSRSLERGAAKEERGKTRGSRRLRQLRPP